MKQDFSNLCATLGSIEIELMERQLEIEKHQTAMCQLEKTKQKLIEDGILLKQKVIDEINKKD